MSLQPGVFVPEFQGVEVRLRESQAVQLPSPADMVGLVTQPFFSVFPLLKCRQELSTTRPGRQWAHNQRWEEERPVLLRDELMEQG